LLRLKIPLLFVTCFVASAIASPSREIRIGVDQAAPYQSWGKGGGPVGFSVEVLNEAARRKHLRLRWMECPEGPTRALKSKKVDMWPLLTVEAGRQLGLYVPEPWVENQYATVWKRDEAETQRKAPSWAGKTIGVVDLPYSRRVAAQVFRTSSIEGTPNRTVALQKLCQSRVDAAFMEIRILEPMLLDRPAGCEGVKFRVQVDSHLRRQMTLVSSPEFRRETDELRAAIGAMFLDGQFGTIVDRWFVFSNVEAHALADYWDQRQRNRYSLAALAGMTILACLKRKRREKRFPCQCQP
jgi:ABC-type amino acid transport substrate-binding protein